MPPIPARDVVARLTQITESKPISEFNQRGVARGVCRGISLDWIRRVLNSKDPAYKDPENAQKKAKRLDRMGKTADLLTRTAAATVARNNADLDKIAKAAGVVEAERLALQRDDAAFETRFEAWKVMPPAQKEPLRAGIKQDMAALEERQAAHQAEFEKIARDRARADPIADRIKLEGHTPVIWQDFSEEWQRTFQNRKTTFKPIEAVRGKPLTKFTNLAAHVEQIASDDMFATATCMLWTFTESEATVGHSIALHRVGPASFQLFDPNYGVYSSSSRDKVISAITYLFGTVYVNDEPPLKAEHSECTVFRHTA